MSWEPRGVGPTLGLGLALGLADAPGLGLALAEVPVDAGLLAGVALGLGEAELEPLGVGLGDDETGSGAPYVRESQSLIPVISIASRPAVQAAMSWVRAVWVA